MDDKKKKRFVKPDAEVVDFSHDDIITLSERGDNVDWFTDPNGEDWA